MEKIIEINIRTEQKNATSLPRHHQKTTKQTQREISAARKNKHPKKDMWVARNTKVKQKN